MILQQILNTYGKIKYFLSYQTVPKNFPLFLMSTEDGKKVQILVPVKYYRIKLVIWEPHKIVKIVLYSINAEESRFLCYILVFLYKLNFHIR